MESNKKIFHSNIGIIIFDGLLTTFAITLLLVLAYEFIAYNIITYLLYSRREIYFLCLGIGIIAAVIIQCFRFTRVYIEQGEFFKYVVIKRAFKKKYYRLGKNFFSEKTYCRKHGAFTINKRYIIIMNKDKNYVVKRLYGFSANGLYSLIDEIHKTQTEMIPVKEKEKMIRDSWDSSLKLELPVEKIVKSEWKSVRFNSLIFIAVVVFLTIALLFFENDEYGNVKNLVIIMAASVCIIEIPFEIYRTLKNLKRCPERVEFIGDHLIIGEHHFIVSDIEKVIMTSLDRKSNSIYPVQRYMIIKTDMQKYKFWLGSENSGINDEYKIICGIIRYSFINEPEKLMFR